MKRGRDHSNTEQPRLAITLTSLCKFPKPGVRLLAKESRISSSTASAYLGVPAHQNIIPFPVIPIDATESVWIHQDGERQISITSGYLLASFAL
jgi:hypothetical protein